MIVSNIVEMTVMAILERGVPNEECIAIKINEQINLGQYGIMIGIYSEKKSAFPIKDNLFWFGDGIVNKGDWLFIYTGTGEPQKALLMDDETYTYNVFWGKQKTIFANTNVVPMLFRVDAVEVLEPPENLPQIKRLE